MSLERGVTRRDFIRRAVSVVAGIVAGGSVLSESDRSVVGANRDELVRFLESPMVEQPEYGPRTDALISHVGLHRACDMRWIHGANSRSRLDPFFESLQQQGAELDFRFDNERGLYIGHDKGESNDIDPSYLQQRLDAQSSTNPKAIKYDCKDGGSLVEVIGQIGDEPCIINADLFGTDRHRMSPQALVDLAGSRPGVIFSIGRNLSGSRYTKEMLETSAELVRTNPHQEFTLPVHIRELTMGTEPFEWFLTLPRTTLTVYRTRRYPLAQAHVDWLRAHLPDRVRAKTFFDL